jgi:RNA polymerase sigma-70 factor, ECF subfamily
MTLMARIAKHHNRRPRSLQRASAYAEDPGANRATPKLDRSSALTSGEATIAPPAFIKSLRMTAVQDPESTATLLLRIRDGDRDAGARIMARYLPILRNWAHGRLPHRQRDVADTDDLVQVTLMRVLKNLPEFQSSGSGSLLAYMRQILLNEVRGEMRKREVRGVKVPLDDSAWRDDSDSVVAHLIGADRMRAYDAALAALPRAQQELVLMRLEFGLDYAEIGLEVGANANTVRMRISRALEHMAAHIAEHWNAPA